MKKFFAIFSIFLFLLVTTNTVTVVAQQKEYSQGIYTAKDLNLSPNMSINIQNISTNSNATVIIFDSNQLLQQAFRLKPHSQKYALLPIDYDYTIVIIGGGKLVFS